MRLIYHLLPRALWEKAPAGPYRADSLATEGFIHCSEANQVAASANRFYAGEQDLLLLHIDPARLTSPLREEPSGSGELFPHVYGPLDRAAIVAIRPMQRDADGRWAGIV